MMKQKRAYGTQIVRANKTSGWATVGPAKYQAPTHILKLYVRVVIEYEAGPTGVHLKRKP